MPEAVADAPIAMIHRRQIDEDFELRLLEGAVHRGTRDAVMACQFSDGITLDPPPVEFPSHMRQEFGIFMHETRVDCDLWYPTGPILTRVFYLFKNVLTRRDCTPS